MLPPQLRGVDHVDIRVPDLAAVEPFYDALFPPLGLSRKTEAHVGTDGEWYDVDASRPRNTVEFHTPLVPGTRGWFVGFIEAPGMTPTATRIAFAIDDETRLSEIADLVGAAGGRVVEYSIDAGYPALFFEDPAGTRLEVCARRPRG